MFSVGKVARVGMLLFGALMLSASLGGCNDSLKTENDALKNENVTLRDQLAAEKQRADACDAERAQLQAQLAAGPKTGTSKTSSGDTGFDGDVSRGAHGEIIVRVPGDVLFASGQVDLKAGSKASLAKIASVIKSKYPDKIVRVEGYTDSDKITKSKWTDNLELSAHRAMSVVRYLKTQGVSDNNMYAAGFGANNPVTSNGTAAGKAKNRRVEIVVLTQ